MFAGHLIEILLPKFLIFPWNILVFLFIETTRLKPPPHNHDVMYIDIIQVSKQEIPQNFL